MSESIVIQKRDGFRRVCDALDASNNAINLTGYTIKSELRKSPRDSVAVLFTIENVDLVNGRFALKLTSAQTAALNAGEYQFDILFTPPTGEPFRSSISTIEVKEIITR